jgi:hypothetical protein
MYIHRFEKLSDAPLVSSNPNCPIVDLKIMLDNGQGMPMGEPSPNLVKIQTDVPASTGQVEMNTATLAEVLKSGEKMNLILIGVTASGKHMMPGETLMWEILLPQVEETPSEPATGTTTDPA